jgi:Arc/MetJ family transcription regulator
MTKRLIELDDELLASARAELGTEGVSDTVRAALRHAVASSARARQVQWLVDGGLESLIDKNERDVVWR